MGILGSGTLQISATSLSPLLAPSTSGASSTSSTSSVKPVDSDGDNDAATSHISKRGQMLAQLQQLKDTNPDQLKAVASQIASQLSAAAQAAGNTSQGKFLANLASKFSQVAASGDLSSLQPSAKSANSASLSGGDLVQQLHESGNQGSSSSGVKSMLDQINQEIGAAVANTSAASSSSNSTAAVAA